MASEKILTLNNDNFQDVINGDQPVLVDFWAEWCGPCRMVAPVLEELADSQEKVVIGKLNVDENQDLAFQYQVSSIPTFVLFQNGQVKDRMMGAMPKSAFERFLEKHVA